MPGEHLRGRSPAAAELMREQQGDTGDRDRRSRGEAPRRPLAEHRPAEQADGDEQQREHRRHHARGDVAFGEIDGVEVDAELGEAEERDRRPRLASRCPGSRPDQRDDGHRERGDDEAIGDRPLRRDRARSGRG